MTHGNFDVRRMVLCGVVATASLFAAGWATAMPLDGDTANKGIVIAIAQSDELPVPDFSDLARYYEVVKYDYEIGSGSGKLNMILVPKVKSRPAFKIHFYDADSVELINETFLIGTSTFTEVGHAERVFGYTPREAMMAQVKRVVILRSDP